MLSLLLSFQKKIISTLDKMSSVAELNDSSVSAFIWMYFIIKCESNSLVSKTKKKKLLQRHFSKLVLLALPHFAFSSFAFFLSDF